MTRKRTKYHQVEDGEWIQPIMRGHKEQCCSCGLVHVTDYRVVDGRVQYRSRRDGRATGGARARKSDA